MFFSKGGASSTTMGIYLHDSLPQPPPVHRLHDALPQEDHVDRGSGLPRGLVDQRGLSAARASETHTARTRYVGGRVARSPPIATRSFLAEAEERTGSGVARGRKGRRPMRPRGGRIRRPNPALIPRFPSTARNDSTATDASRASCLPYSWSWPVEKALMRPARRQDGSVEAKYLFMSH